MTIFHELCILADVCLSFRYNFQTVQRYKALSYEEAEEEFNSRDRTYNLWSVMLRKRMKKEDEAGDDGDEEGEGKGKGKKKKNAKGTLFNRLISVLQYFIQNLK